MCVLVVVVLAYSSNKQRGWCATLKIKSFRLGAKFGKCAESSTKKVSLMASLVDSGLFYHRPSIFKRFVLERQEPKRSHQHQRSDKRASWRANTSEQLLPSILPCLRHEPAKRNETRWFAVACGGVRSRIFGATEGLFATLDMDTAVTTTEGGVESALKKQKPSASKCVFHKLARSNCNHASCVAWATLGEWTHEQRAMYEPLYKGLGQGALKTVLYQAGNGRPVLQDAFMAHLEAL